MYNFHGGAFMSFYKNYVRLCNGIGLSPSAAAENVGIKKSNVTHWRDGGGVRDSTIEKLCNTYGWTRDQLFVEGLPISKKRDEPIALNLPEFDIPEDQAELNDLYMMLNDSAKHTLLTVAKGLASNPENLSKNNADTTVSA